MKFFRTFLWFFFQNFDKCYSKLIITFFNFCCIFSTVPQSLINILLSFFVNSSIFFQIFTQRFDKITVEVCSNSLTRSLTHSLTYSQRAALNVIRAAFKNQLISHGKDIDIQWLPRRPNLSVCNFFVSGCLKSKVYNNKQYMFLQLKISIREETAKISQQLCRESRDNFKKCLSACIQCNGGYLDNVLFK